jgi:hypothetical protein
VKKSLSDIFISFLTLAETTIGRITVPIERFSHRYLLAFNRWLLAKIDPLSYAIEGTVLKKVLQVTIYPVFLILTIFIGFDLVKHGYTAQTFIGNVLSILAIGVIFAPLERLLPFSRKWADDKDEPTDIMIFFGNIVWSRYINSAIELATISLVVQEISPHIGQAIWPSHWNPIVQVLLLLCINDFFRYWYHRWMHENKIMWRWHSVHHSSKRLYWFNAYHHSKKIEEGHSNYGGDVIIWDLLFGTFYLPKGKQPSDDIGIAEMPNYPQNWIGLMLAPFTFNKIKKEAEQGVVGKDEELLEIEDTSAIQENRDSLRKPFIKHL